MQISWSKYFEQKQQERILLTTSLMKDIHDMTEKEKIIYRKYVHKWQKYEESEESKDPNDTKKNAENQFQDKKKIPEDSRVQPDPQTSKKRENLKRKETSKKTEMPNPEVSVRPFEPKIRKVFPIYSHGKVCGYFYANENEVPPKKVALTNIGSAIKQTSPNLHPLIKPVQVIQPPKRTTTPQVLSSLTTLLLSNISSNNVTPVFSTTTNSVPPSQTVNTLPLVMKSLDETNTLKPLSVIPIVPAPVKVQHFIPATIQTSNIRQTSSNLHSVTANSNDQNKTNIIPTFLQPSGCNINSSNCQSTFITSENQNGTTMPSSPVSSPEKQINDLEIQDTMQSCRLKKKDEISIKTETASDNICEENLELVESNIHQKNCLISLLPNSAQDVQIEITDEDKTDFPDDKSEQENNYGLVITSFFSLSSTNASEFGFAFDN